VSKEQEINLTKLIERSNSEERCRAYLEGLRWPDGATCPRCGSDKISRIKTRDQLDCDSCRYRFSITAGTILHGSHLPLWKWFIAVYLIVGAEKDISINQIRYTIGVSYKTAWYLCHRIRAALLEVDMRLMGGMREANEMLLGGEVEDKGIRYRANKTLFDAANSTKTTQSSRDIVECCPQIQAELLDTYLNELRYRFNNRANPYMLRDALWKLIIVGNLPY
jgi:transposase-like protein